MAKYYLIEHPFQPHSSRALIFSGTADPVEIVQFIECLCDGRDIATPVFDRENLPIGANILVAIQQGFKPSTSRPLHRQDSKESNWCACTFFPITNKETNKRASYSPALKRKIRCPSVSIYLHTYYKYWVWGSARKGSRSLELRGGGKAAPFLSLSCWSA